MNLLVLAAACVLLSQTETPQETPPVSSGPKSVRELRQAKPFLPGVIVSIEPEQKAAATTAAATQSPTTEPAANPLGLTETEQEMIKQLNAFRARNGRPPLTPTAYLMASARAQAQRQAAANRMFHQSGVQENVACGTRTVAGTMQMWINSSGHNANMLTGNRECGVGVAVSSSGQYYWCQVFASNTATSQTPADSIQQPAQQPRQPVSSGNYYRRGLFRRW